MTIQEFEQLEVNVLALRNLANTVLKQIQEAKNTEAGTSDLQKKRKANRISRSADMEARIAEMKARIISGHLKPDRAKKK